MPVMDEFKKERETMKHASFSKKLEYFKDYYLVKTLLILFVAILGGSYLHSVLTAKKTALYVTLVNFTAMKESDDELLQPFAEQSINTRRERIVLDHSSYISSDKNEADFVKYGYEDEQRLFSMVMTGEIDLFITGEDVIDRYAQQEWFDDVRSILSETEYAALEQENRILFRNQVPIAIQMNTDSILTEYYYYNGKPGVTLYAGFPAGGAHQKLGAEFVRYLQTK